MTPNNSEDLIRIEGLAKSYPSHQGEATTVLSGVDFRCQRGESIALTGPSGSGKSTLLHILGLLLKPSSGQFLFQGQSVMDLSSAQRNELRSQTLGFVFQKHLLLPELSLLENVCLPLAQRKGWSGENRKRALDMLESLGLKHRAQARPPQLSGGEAQRGAIARALVHRPQILLLDEPTGNLDPDMSQQLMSTILGICDEHTISCITVTHNLELAQMMNRHYRVAHHQLLES